MQNPKSTDPLADFMAKCKQHQLKITPQRIAIFKEIRTSKAHPSVDDMYRTIKKQFPSVSFDTVNRTLLTFSEIGLVDLVEGQGGPRRFDPNRAEHHHFHCIKCGRIVDVFEKGYDELEIPASLKKRFKILNKRVVLNGICDRHGTKRQTDSLKGEKYG